MPATTSLYRFFDSRGDLLYIGVTNRIPRRLDEHHENKPWYHEVAQVKVEHLSDRDTALRTEKAAIETEHPKYNVVHNRGPHRVPSQRDEGVYTHITSWRKSVTPGGRWVFRYLKGRNPERVDLFLYPELAGAPVLDDFYDLTGEEQFEEYIRYVRRHNPEWLEKDAVPIYWSVSAESFKLEAAPFQHPAPHFGDFLAHYTWPLDAVTGERLDWYQLPVKDHRFPEFAKALGWVPSPLQPTCPLASILRSRRGQYVNSV